MDIPLVSIIVPVYKVERYLRKCVDSILTQTYTNIEVILVDDGSPDGCPAICDEYAQKDKRVVVIHQENAGVSAARNAGLDIAKGDYISFVDSDDWIEPDMYEVLCDVAIKSGADIVESSHCENDDKPVKVDKYVTFSSRNAMMRILHGQWEMFYLWRKLFAREVIEQLRFIPEITITEDGVFVIKAIAKSKNISYINYKCYHYILRNDSASHTFNDSFWQTLESTDLIVEVIKNYNVNFLDAADRCAIQFALNMSKAVELAGKFTKYAHQRVSAHIRKHIRTGTWKLLSSYEKFWICLILLGRKPFIVGKKFSRLYNKL